MAVNYDVKAQVVDIQNDNPTATDVFLVDSNVWYWMTYTRASLSDRPPNPRQTTDYPGYVSRALTAKATLHRCELSLSELAHLIERTELEVYARSSGFDKNKPKEFRHNLPVERSGVVAEIQTAWGQVKTLASPLSITFDEALGDAALARLPSQPLDGYDLFMLETIAANGVVKVITDDGDFATVPGITVFTANRNVIAAARSQGTLITR